MKAIQIAENVYWVGAIDWRLRNFHGYQTQRGSTYNAYLIIDEKITLIDTVKEYLADEMLTRISSVIDPQKIDYIVCNHSEMDHSGTLPKLLEVLKGKSVFASPNGVGILQEHYGDLDIIAKKTGETLNIGKRTLHFVNTPMVHWPDNMVTWSPEDKILFSNDAFGQHLATPERFADELPFDIVRQESQKYYANIVMPFAGPVQKALAQLGGLPIEMIAPSHGVIWRTPENIATILSYYTTWSNNDTKPKAVVVYDSMWGSTQTIANIFPEIFAEFGITCQPIHLQDTPMADIMSEILEARYICVGSSTINNGMLPTVSAFLTYLKGLAPKNRHGITFGSHGWNGFGSRDVQAVLEQCKFTTYDPLTVKFVPDETELNTLKDALRTILTNAVA